MRPDKSTPGGLSPFERMVELARRIVAVPKEEIDRKEAEYKRQRAAKRKRKSQIE